jgi:hypothetical protein
VGELGWRVHDRTHLEVAIEYPVTPACEHVWEAYIFVPASFRLQEDTYDKKAIYDDLWSYVRFSPRRASLAALVAPGGAAPRLAEALRAAAGVADATPAANVATRRLRLYACQLRAALLTAADQLQGRVDRQDPSAGAAGLALARETRAAIEAMRAAVAAAGDLSEHVRVSAEWSDEDISLVVESVLAQASLALERHAHDSSYLGASIALAEVAAAEARHRADVGCDSVAGAGATARDVEHLEFRRHAMKRFTSSVLWLAMDVRDAAGWAVHAFYGLAAAVAMTFALVASVSASPISDSAYRYGVAIVIAYAVKDRMKAFLQRAFDGVVARRFPDRKWSLSDRERGLDVGSVRERAAFLPMSALPEDVLHSRRLTRVHPLEDGARPERVLWHKKSVVVRPAAAVEASDLPTLTEIFRLNVRRWLEHADDPNQVIAFADPKDGRLHEAKARRVYNVNVVYRLAHAGQDAPWRRLRVVVSRKGIDRIDVIR